MSDVNLAKGWSAVCIADISYKGEQCKPAQDAEFSYIDIGSINRNLKCIESPQHVIGKDAPSRARKIVNTGDVLVSLTRPNLNAVALVPAEYNNQIASTGFEVIKSLLVDSRYIFALTRSKNFIDSISGVVQGALYPAAKSSDVQAFEFPLPPLAEQKVIADKLDTLLAQVETSKARLDRIPQILKTFRQSVLAAAVSGKLTEDFVGNQRKLKSIVEFKQGTQVPSSEQVDEKLDGFDRFLRIINFTQGEQAFKYVPTKKSNRIISEDDVVMVRYGATSGFVGRGLSGVLANNLFVISPDESILSKTYLYTFLTSPIFQNSMKQMVKGGAMPAISFKLFDDIEIKLPTMESQHNTVRRVEELFAFADRIEQKANAAFERVNNLTQAILAKAFRGELTADWRAANPDLISGENSAEALLMKIKAEREALSSKKKPKKKTAARKKA